MKPFHQGKQRLRLVYRDNLDFPVHLQDAVEIIYVLEGESLAFYENKKIPLSSGDLFVAFPNRIHGFAESRGIRAYVLICPSESVVSSFGASFEKKSPRSPCIHLPQKEKESIRCLLDFAFEDFKEGTKPLKEGYTSVLIEKMIPLLSFREEEKMTSSALSVVLRYINDHYKEGISRQGIADAVGYHESYLSHLFCENLGKTLSEYISSLRLADATELLEETDESISTIALSLGFGSIRSFNRAFLKTMHTSPSAYRLQKRKT